MPREASHPGTGVSRDEPAVTLVVPIASDLDIVAARQRGRMLATKCGYAITDAALIATVISELARNIVLYATRGEIRLTNTDGSGQPRIVIVARDEGPGIADVSRAVAGGHSTSGGLGMGLSIVRRLVDKFEISSVPGRGTTITITLWKPDQFPAYRMSIASPKL